MGTLSSLTGGGSGGGGGDPTGKFQASATVANGDLVVLNDNGTVAPVTSTAIASDFTKSDNGTKVQSSSSPSGFGMTAYSGAYNQTHDKYLWVYRDDTGNVYSYLKQANYDNSSETFTNVSQRTQISMYAHWMSQKRGANEGYPWGYRGTNGYMYVRGIYWNGSNYTVTSEATASNQTIATASCYCEASGEGSSSFAIGGMVNSGSEFSMAHGTWNGSSSSPTLSHGASSLSDQRPSNTPSGTRGTSWNSSSYAGCHVKDDIHMMVGSEGGTAKMIACRVEASGTTYGTKKSTGLTWSAYPSRIIYDNVANIGVYNFYSSGVPVYLPFSVDYTTLDVTTYSSITLPSGFTGYSSGLGWSPFARVWVAVDHNGGEIFHFTLDSSGTVTTSGTGQFAPNAPNLSSLRLQFQHMFPIHGSGGLGFMFNNDHVVGGGGAGSYMDATNHTFISRFDLPYVSENIDKYFGEAKEAISSGAAGSVAILNRTKDIPNSTFQKGQKLFANPSGTALATSGTYRVGHATDADTVLVLGDPS